MEQRSLLAVILKGSVFKAFHSLSFFGISILLARTLSTSDFGIYNILHTSILLLASFLQFGFPEFLVKHNSRRSKTTSVANNQTIYANASCWIVFAIITFSFVSRTDLNNFSLFNSLDNRIIAAAIVTAAIGSFTILNNAVIRTNGRLLLGQVSDQIIAPVVLLTLLASLAIFNKISLLNIALTYSIAFFCGLLFSLYALTLLKVTQKKPRAYNLILSSKEYKSVFFIALLSITTAAQVQIVPLIISFFASYEEVAYFRISFLLSVALVMIMQPINLSAGPYISRLYGNGDLHSLSTQITLITRKIVYLSALFSVLTIFFRAELIEIIFGQKFLVATSIVPILMISNFVGVLFGPTAIVLVMTDDEKFVASASMYSAICLLIVLCMLVPGFGATGAAFSILITSLAFKAVLWLRVKSRLGIDCSVFGKHTIDTN